jgi:hypothetical protein
MKPSSFLFAALLAGALALLRRRLSKTQPGSKQRES